jgi:hypothetical protein
MKAPAKRAVLAALQTYFHLQDGGVRAVFTAKAGVEWASPWKFFLGTEAGLVVEPGGLGYQLGGFLGVRF